MESRKVHRLEPGQSAQLRVREPPANIKLSVNSAIAAAASEKALVAPPDDGSEAAYVSRCNLDLSRRVVFRAKVTPDGPRIEALSGTGPTRWQRCMRELC